MILCSSSKEACNCAEGVTLNYVRDPLPLESLFRNMHHSYLETMTWERQFRVFRYRGLWPVFREQLIKLTWVCSVVLWRSSFWTFQEKWGSVHEWRCRESSAYTPRCALITLVYAFRRWGLKPTKPRWFLSCSVLWRYILITSSCQFQREEMVEWDHERPARIAWWSKQQADYMQVVLMTLLFALPCKRSTM